MSQHRRSGGLIAAIVGGALWTAGCLDGNPTVSIGDPLPVAELSPSQPSLVWVFDAERCLGCTLRPSAGTVRRLQHELRDRIDVVVIALGEGGNENRDRVLVGSFLRGERVNARVAWLSRQAYAREFGHAAPTSALYVAEQGRLVEIIEENEVAAAAGQIRVLLETARTPLMETEK